MHFILSFKQHVFIACGQKLYKMQQFTIRTASTIWLRQFLLERKGTLDNLILYSLCVFMLWRHKEIGSEDGEWESSWFKIILSLFTFLVKLWNQSERQKNILQLECPFVTGCPSNPSP